MTSKAPEGLGLSSSKLSMVFEAEEDIEQELEDFVRLKRIGEYDRAHRHFHQTLAKNAHLFPVTAEYADLLLEQHDFRTLSGFLDIQMQCMEGIFEEDEMELLNIMKSLAGIHTRGELRSALSRARESWQFLWDRRTRIPQGGLPRDVEIHIFEVYISIVAFAVATSRWAGLDDMRCPWTGVPIWARTGFVQWYQLLSQHDQLWEASRVLRILLPILPALSPEDAGALFDKDCFGHCSTVISPTQTDEPEQLIEFVVTLSRAQALVRMAVMLHGHQPDSLEPKGMFEMARSYHRFADVKLTFFPLDIQHGLHYCRLMIQKVEFQRAERVLGLSKLSQENSSLSLTNLNESIILQDRDCFISSKMSCLMECLEGYHETFKPSDCLASLHTFQAEKLGDYAGFIRTWDLCRMMLERFSGHMSTNHTKTCSSPELDTRFMFQSLAKKEQATDSNEAALSILWDIAPIVNIYDDSRVKLKADSKLLNAQHLPVSFDVPLLLWTVNNTRASLASGGNFYSTHDNHDYIGMVRGDLPGPITAGRVGRVATRVKQTLDLRERRNLDKQRFLSKDAEDEVIERSPGDIKGKSSEIKKPDKTNTASSAGHRSYPIQRLSEPIPEAPSFNEAEILESVCGGSGCASRSMIKPEIQAQIHKGFFLSDEKWTCYRHNCFSVSCLFTLQPWSTGPFWIMSSPFWSRSSWKPVGEIQAFSMSVSAIMSSNFAEIRGLVQHTPKQEGHSKRKPGKVVLQPCKLPGSAPLSYGPGIQRDLEGVALASQSARKSIEYKSANLNTELHSQLPTRQTFEGIQFQEATVNKGKHRHEQEYYNLVVELYANIAVGATQSRWVKIARSLSQPIIVRDSSPGH